MQFRGFELYPFQAEAIEGVQEGRSVIVSAPTGAGKTIVAEYAIEQSIQRNRRVVYTSPIKALSNQKYREFKERYGDKVGIMTGDVTINPDALILVMTTEIFRNTIFEDESRLHGIDWLIFDEVHYLGDPDRGSVWEESIIFAPTNVRFIALSATVGNLKELQNWMSEVRKTTVDMVHTDERPVPQHRLLFLPEDGIFEVKELKEKLGRAKSELKKLGKGGRRAKGRPNRHHQPRGHDVVRLLVKDKKTPILYFCFSRKKCESLARRYQRLPSLLTRSEQDHIGGMFDELIDKYGIGDHPACRTMRGGVTRGILYHHAGVLPIFKDVIERLFTTGLVKILFATETFALGVNMPARCVIFDSLSKYNGVEVVPLRPLDYRQMAGRAGRQGIDEAGDVVAILDPSFDTPKGVREILHKKPGDVVSQFLLGYSTTLHLIRLMGPDISAAVAKSFAAFQAGSAKKPLRDLECKLQVLTDRHYLSDGQLTGKGQFCTKLAGFEIQLTELYWEGCFEDLDPIQCAIICAAIIHQSRPRDTSARLEINPIPRPIVNKTRKRLREFRKAEVAAGFEPIVNLLDFGLAAPLNAWLTGSTLPDLQRWTSMQEGDLVRAFRLTVQVLRQLAWALPKDNSVAENCRAAILLINRNEVDAEAQLNTN